MSSAVIRISEYEKHSVKKQKPVQIQSSCSNPPQRTWFYKSTMPEPIINERMDLKSLSESCRISALDNK